MSQQPDLGTVLTNILNAVASILSAIASAIAQNANVIATVIVVGALVYLMIRYGTRVFRGLTGWVRGLF